MGAIIFGSLAIAACIVPFLYVSLGRKQVERKLKSGLDSLATSINSSLGMYDLGIEFGIGLDTSKKILYFYKNMNGNITRHTIFLADIAKCYAQDVKRTIQHESGKEVITDKLHLVLTPFDQQENPVVFTFFDAEEHFRPNGELPVIRKWEKIINDMLSDRYVFPKAS